MTTCFNQLDTHFTCIESNFDALFRRLDASFPSLSSCNFEQSREQAQRRNEQACARTMGSRSVSPAQEACRAVGPQAPSVGNPWELTDAHDTEVHNYKGFLEAGNVDVYTM
jgi:hypothetical protein